MKINKELKIKCKTCKVEITTNNGVVWPETKLCSDCYKDRGNEMDKFKVKMTNAVNNSLDKDCPYRVRVNEVMFSLFDELNENEEIKNKNKYSYEREKKICYYCEEETELWEKKGENAYQCGDHTHCLKMAGLKGLTGKELKQKCYKCGSVPKFIIREELNTSNINSPFKCQDEVLCKTVSELNEKNTFCCEISKDNQKQSTLGDRMMKCMWCDRTFLAKPLCPEHKKLRSQPNETHHGSKAPDGKCQQCLEEGKLVKEWNGKYYCKDCKDWNDEGADEGIGTYARKFWESWCGGLAESENGCGTCNSCKGRKKHLTGVPTRDLMIEVMTRPEFEALLTWEDDGFKSRYGEIMWELTQVEDLSPDEIEEKVNEDVFEKKLSQRKFSRGI